MDVEDDESKKIVQILSKFRYTRVNRFLGTYGESEKVRTAIGKTYNNRSLFLFSRYFFLRRWVIRLLVSVWFERIILFLIAVNCGIMTLYDPLNEDAIGNQILSASELFFQIIFTVEMALKIFGMGFLLHPYSYLRDPWNWLDFFIVVTGYLSFLDVGNLSVLRAFRLLRPLRVVSGLHDMRMVINSLLQSVPMLSNSFVLYFFVVLLYSIMGIQLFSGQLRWQCHHVLTDKVDDDDNLCAIPGTLWGRPCPDDYICKQGENPFGGGLSYDNIFISLSTVFTVMTTEGWTNVLYLTSSSTGRLLAMIYFISVILFGSFFVINLFLAIVTDNFDRSVLKEREMEKAAKLEEELEIERLKAEGKVPVLKEKSFLEKVFAKVILLYDILAEVVISKIPFQQKSAEFVRWIVETKFFSAVFFVLTMANTIALAVEFYGMPNWLVSGLNISFYIFTVFFLIEMIMKMYGLGLKRYVSDPFNVLDAFIVLISFVDFFSDGTTGVNVFRTLRLLRVIQLVRISNSLERLLKVFVNSMKGALMLSILLILVIFIYALIGMQFFGGKFEEGGHEWMEDEDLKPRGHFDTFFNAMITSFLIIVSEDFQWMKYDGMMATNQWAAIYYISLYAIGNYIVLSLFIGVLLAQFHAYDEDLLERQQEEAGTMEVKSVSITEAFFAIVCFWKTRKRTIIHPFVVSKICDSIRTDDEVYRSIDQIATLHREKSLVSVDEEVNDIFDLGIKKPKQHDSYKRNRNILVQWLIGDYSLFIFPNTIVRRALKRIVSSKVFEFVILFFIVMSSITLVLEDPFTPPDEPIMIALFWINIFLTIVFTIEAILKIISNGFLFQRGAYLRNWWNILDFFIVVTAIASFVINDNNLMALRTFRLLRTLRPLRFIRRIPGLKIVVDTLISSIPSIINVILLSLVMYLLFGILGVRLLSGHLRYCHDKNGEPSEIPWSNKALCEEDGGVWENDTNFHYDNLINAMLTLFTVPIFEGFPTRLYTAMDTVDIDVAPSIERRWYTSFFYFTFIVIGAFFFTNLFVGVLIDHYSNLSGNGKSAFLTEAQKRWVDMQKFLIENRPSYQPKPPKYDCCYIRKVLYTVVNHPLFEIFIMVLIFLNIIMMATQHHEQAEAVSISLIVLNYVFTLAFVVEAMIKLIAYNPIGYFRDLWNVFDFVVVWLGILGLVLGDSGDFVSFASIFRIFRVAKLFKLIQVAKGMRQLLKTLFLSIPSLLNVSALLILAYFIFAVLGMKIFYNLSWDEPWDDGINEFANFRNIFTAMLTLVRISTGEDWHEFLEDAMVTPPRCSTKRNTCGDPIIGALFFCTFMLTAYHVLVNLFVAVILDNFSSTIDNVDSQVTDKTLKHFASCWKKYDPQKTLYIDNCDLVHLIIDIGEPLGVDSSLVCYQKHIRILLQALELNDYDDKVYYHEVLLKLAQLKFGVELPNELDSSMKKKWKGLLPQRKGIVAQQRQLQKILAAKKLQQYWRKLKMERRLSEKQQTVVQPLDFKDLSEIQSFRSSEYDPANDEGSNDSELSVMSLSSRDSDVSSD